MGLRLLLQDGVALLLLLEAPAQTLHLHILPVQLLFLQEGHTRQPDRKTNREREEERDRETDRQKDRQTDREREEEREEERDRETDRQKDKQGEI